MVVVPPVAECDDTEEVVVDAVVGYGKVFVAEARQVANDVHPEWNIEGKQTADDAGGEDFPTEDEEQGDAIEDTEHDIQSIADGPIAIAFERSVNWIFQQIWALLFGIDVIWVMKVSVKSIGVHHSHIGSMWVQWRLHMFVMGSVNRRPPYRRPMISQVCAKNKKILQCFVTSECAVGQQSMQTNCYSVRVPQIEHNSQSAKENWIFHKTGPPVLIFQFPKYANQDWHLLDLSKV